MRAVRIEPGKRGSKVEICVYVLRVLSALSALSEHSELGELSVC